MVLDFGLLNSGLFGESGATGVGLGGDRQQTIINEVATGVYYLGIYSGTGFDSTKTGAGSNSANYTIQMTPDQLVRYNTLFIKITVLASGTWSASSFSASLRTQTQETGGGGGGWSDLLGTTTILGDYMSGSYGGLSDYATGTIELVKVLTAGEKANGIDIKITSTSNAGGGPDSAFVSNKNVVIFGAA